MARNVGADRRYATYDLGPCHDRKLAETPLVACLKQIGLAGTCNEQLHHDIICMRLAPVDDEGLERCVAAHCRVSGSFDYVSIKL